MPLVKQNQKAPPPKRQAAQRRFPVAQVARNVEANIRHQAQVVHGQIYANGGGWSPDEVLAALGDKAEHVLAWLAKADLIAATAIVAPPSPAVLVVPEGSGQ